MGSATTIAYRVTWQLEPGLPYVSMPGVLGVELDVQATEGTSGLGAAVFATTGVTIRATATEAVWPWVTALVEVQVNGGAWQAAYRGPLVARADDGISYRYSGGGWDAVIERQPLRMPLRENRPIATATAGVAATAEDPATGAPGLINEAIWRCGGRPASLAGTYPAAPFYYACDATAMSVPYAAIDGDNAWQEILELAQAAGGQLLQDGNGVLRFVNPLRLADSEASPPHLTNADYRRMSVEESTAATVSAAIASYQRRAVQGDQLLYEDTSPRTIPASGSLTETLSMSSWVRRYRVVVASASFGDGVGTATPTISTGTASAQRLDVTLTNPSSAAPMLVERVAVYGQPVTATTQGEARVAGASVGRYAAELRLPANRYIQDQDDAERWCRQAQRFGSAYRPIYRCDDVRYDARLIPGAYCLLTNTRRGLSAVGCRVIRVGVRGSGRALSVELIPLTGLPRLSELFVIGTSYADGDTRKVGF